MTSDGSGYRRVQDLFLESIQLPPERREAYLRESAGATDDQIAEVLELLRFHTEDEAADSPRLPAPAEPDAERPPPIASIAGYRILRLLGSGSMGSVYLGQHPETGRFAALKVLSPERTTPGLRERFRIEGEILARLDHPGIARFYDAGLFESAAIHLPYYAMEYVDGTPLRAFSQGRRASDRGRIALLAEICDAVHYANQQGIVHRDLKPENILVDRAGRPKVLDFGIARLIDIDPRATLAMTAVGAILGTPAYMSPEQARGAGSAIDCRSDVYSLGVIGYEMVTGRLPYEIPRNSMAQAISAILTSEPLPAGRVRPELRGSVEAILHKALRKSPDDRYSSAEAMAVDLRRHLAGKRPLIARRPRPRLRTGRGIVAGAAAALAVILALVIPKLLQPPPPSPRALMDQSSPALLEAERLLHWESHDRENLSEGIRILMDTRRKLLAQDDAPITRAMARFVNWRLGEAYYFLGGIDSDPAALKSAGIYWRSANAILFDPRALAGVDSTQALYNAMARVGAHHPLSGIGLAEAALSFYETPAEHLRISLSSRRSAMEWYERRWNGGYVASRDRERIRNEDAGILRNDLAGALTALGAVTDSVPLFSEAVELLREASRVPALADYPDVRLSILRNSALARLERADRLGAISDLDTAVVFLRRVEEMQRGGQKRSGPSATTALLARADLVRARLAGSRAERLTHTESAVDGYERSLGMLNASQDSIPAALRQRDLAEALGELASARGDPEILCRADSLIALAGKALAADRLPVQHAAVLRVEGKLARIRWELMEEGGGPSRDAIHSRALGRFRAALEILPAVHDPSFARRIREEERLLSVGGSAPL